MLAPPWSAPLSAASVRWREKSSSVVRLCSCYETLPEYRNPGPKPRTETQDRSRPRHTLPHPHPPMSRPLQCSGQHRPSSWRPSPDQPLQRPRSLASSKGCLAPASPCRLHAGPCAQRQRSTSCPLPLPHAPCGRLLGRGGPRPVRPAAHCCPHPPPAAGC